MKKKILFGLLVLTLVALPLFGACAPAAPPVAEKVELGFCHLWPATHRVSTEQFPRWINMVEKAAKGKYEIEVTQYHPGMLLGGAEIYDGVVKGIVDMGASCFAYTPGRFPVIVALSQAGIAPPTTSDAAAQTLWEYYNKFKPKELEDTKVLYLYATGPGWLHCKTPVRTLEDVKGLEIRATGASASAIKALGGSPVAMPQAEVYLSAQKGIVKASIAPLEVLKGYKQCEVFDYSTFFGFGYTEHFFVSMNWDKWNALPKDLQAAFDAVAEDAVKDAGALWQYIQKEGEDFATAEATGQEYIILSDAEAAKWIAALKPIRDEYVAMLNGKGLPGEELANEAGKIQEKYNKKTYEPYVP